MPQVRQEYPSDLTDRQWELIKKLIPTARSGGRPRTTDIREVINATFYVIRAGCAWRSLPNDFPPWSAVYMQFVRWKEKGVFIKMHDHLRAGLREALGKNVGASVGIADSQSVKTVEKKGSADLTRIKELRVGNDIYWLITLD